MTMKMKTLTHNFTPDPAAAQRRIESVPLRATIKTNKTMKTLKTIILLVLLAAVPPLLLQAQTTESFTFTTNRFVPDGNAAGLSDVRSVTSAVGNISSLKVRLKITGEFNGDLYGYVRHSSGFAVLLNRVGKTVSNNYGYGDSGLDVTFQTGATNGDIHVYQNVITPADGSPLTGVWDVDGRNVDPTNVTELSARSTSLTNFNGLNGAGEWTLYLGDVESGATNQLTEWSLDISGAASPTLAWSNPANITYGTALSGTQLNARATYSSTNVPGTFTYSYPAGTFLNAGNNQTLSVTFTPNDTSSFLPVTTNVTINVLKAPLTITANDTNKVYGTALPAFTASYNGFTNGDTVASLTTPVTLGTTATATNSVNTYAITASGATSSNYTITHVNGTLSITPATLTIAAQNTNKVYGAALPTFTASYTGFVNGDDATSLDTPVTLGTSATASSPVGSYAITATGAADVNYTITHVNGTLTITTATITVTANDKSKAYGAALPTLTATYTGFIPGQDTNNLTGLATLTTTAATNSPVGTYPITAGGATSTNYTFNYVAGTLTVTPVTITVTADDKSKAYGAALPTLTATYTGFVLNQDTNNLTGLATLTTTATTNSAVGTYTITASGATSTNYLFSYVVGTLTVAPATITVTADNKSKAYGAALPALTATYTGFVLNQGTNDLTGLATPTTTAATNSPVGTYPITASGATSTNYLFTYVAGTLTVTPITITVTAGNKSKAYGAALPALTATYSGFVSNQGTNDLTGLASLTTTATATSDVGTYPITASGAISSNYTFSYVGGTLIITQSLSSGAVVSSANPALPGTNVTFTMTVHAVAPGAGTPGGAVNFRIDGSVIGSGPLSGGVAAFTNNTLALGSHTVMAEYAGDLNFVGTTNSLAQNQVINTPPVAGNDTVERSPTTSLKVRLSTLLANDSDADGDTLNITVSSTSAGNATITVSGGWVFYTPAAGFTNADSFTYTITDGRGGSAVGTVTVAIKVDNAPSQNLVITVLGNDQFRIDGSGIPGRTYRLQHSDTAGPFDWQDLTGGSVTADSLGRFQYTDTSTATTRFYRSVYP